METTLEIVFYIIGGAALATVPMVCVYGVLSYLTGRR